MPSVSERALLVIKGAELKIIDIIMEALEGLLTSIHLASILLTSLLLTSKLYEVRSLEVRSNEVRSMEVRSIEVRSPSRASIYYSQCFKAIKKLSCNIRIIILGHNYVYASFLLGRHTQ